ncbi:hypothetical protein [Pseudobacteriovorax antillogorgiicola]|uniref:Uncharacterized protein n=1 Tax=Pseudobacteriovorax antillogorgiicola TaxID=1513793 RepID=A0A1Y6CVU0_9BACT|nr:hypothetical protein [Pseudobacteriovorax antillogorgiicola]TCS44259.1 hypothetical protein EDD56_13459 [Pseudobacteriovorax antillogorgiicola]SMF80803.1 hypothetical protein SAMN06296036_13560 [Pseudobacteriovorax antillogorgiicola]
MDDLELEDRITLESGDEVPCWLTEYTVIDGAIDHDVESLRAEVFLEDSVQLKKGDKIKNKDKTYYVDRVIDTGIGVTEVRLKCVREQKSETSLGRF